MTSADIELSEIETKIFVIRGLKVMLDEDLARLYQVPTKRLNEQVSRNLRRFPLDFMFRLTLQEVTVLRSQIATSKPRQGGRRFLPLAFTEQGVAMLSSALQSDRAIDVNVAIMRAFVRLRQVLSSNQEFEKKLNDLESKYDAKFKIVFDALRKLISHQSVPHKRIIGLNQEKG